MCGCLSAADTPTPSPSAVWSGYVHVEGPQRFGARSSSSPRWLELSLEVLGKRRPVLFFDGQPLLEMSDVQLRGEPRLRLLLRREDEEVTRLRFASLSEKRSFWRAFLRMRQTLQLQEAVNDKEVQNALRREGKPEEEEAGDGESDPEDDDGAALFNKGPRRREHRCSEMPFVERIAWESPSGICLIRQGSENKKRWRLVPRLVAEIEIVYEALVRAILRPPRRIYLPARLGPKKFQFESREFRRRDLATFNERGKRVLYSTWRSKDEIRASVIYIHGNASCRLDALTQLSLGLSLGVGVQFVALDCCGSGLSDGDYVSLGFKEQDDIVAVMDDLRRQKLLGPKVALWGRSMGAVTALLAAATRTPLELCCVVADSAFTSLREIALDIVGKAAPLTPTFVGRSLLAYLVRPSVKKRAGFDLLDVDALKHAAEVDLPVMLINASDDTFVPPAHSKRLNAALAGSVLVVSRGCDHNGIRTAGTYTAVEAFLRTQLDMPLPREPFAVAMDNRLCCLAAPITDSDTRPNFGALAPWTIEKNSKIVHANAGGRRRYFNDEQEALLPSIIQKKPLDHHHHLKSFDDDAAASGEDTAVMESMQRAALDAATAVFK